MLSAARRVYTRRPFSRNYHRTSIEQLERRDLFAGLVDQGDLQYLGAFRVPSGSVGSSTFEYGGGALAYNPANNSLFVVGHELDRAVAEISIPTLGTGSLSSLSTASVLQPFANVFNRVPNESFDDPRLGGLMVVGNQLVVSAYEFYDASGTTTDSHFKLSSLNLANASATGMFRVGDLGGGYTGGYMATVASEWQDDFGFTYMTGQAGLSIISRTSVGPAAVGFNPTQLGSGVNPITPLVYYTLSDPLAPEMSQNPLFNLTTDITGMVFPEGTDSVLFFGAHGVGEYWYGEPDDNSPADTQRTHKGNHAPPYVYQVWAYDANDLMDVKNGIKDPWEVQPYDVWTLNVPYATGEKWPGGVAYDPASGRIYVSELFQDGAKPVIHVYQVGAPAPDTTPPTISSIAAGSITASGATVTWTTNEASNTQVEYGLTTSYGSQTTLNTSMVTSHSAQVSGLTAGTLYHYRVKSRDAAGNLSVSTDRTFTTAAPDTTAPVISSIATSGVTSTGATVSWTTNEASDTQVEYGLTTSYGSQTTLNTSLVTSHSTQLSGMPANTTYHYRVKSRDAAGNLSVSADGTFTTVAASQGGYSYDNPPPLPPSSPAMTVSVSNVSQLISALNNLQSGWTISLAAGTYNLSGVTDALYVPQGISNWTIRGATGDRDDVVIRGAGMSGSVLFGFWIGNSTDGTIADLTIDGVQEHGIIVNPGSDGILVHNVRVVDSGAQSVKSNPNGSGNGSDNGVVEYCVFEYRTTDNDNYTNGVDIHAGDGWSVHYNLFRNFLSPAGQGLAGPAILAWNGSSNTVVEGNTFINVARGIALGMIDRAGSFDHQGGFIANNVFYRDPSLPQEVDVAIMVADSPNTKIFHNTILVRGSYQNAIEYRYTSSSGLQIRNNLTDAPIQARDGATATVSGNTTNAQLNWFINAAAGDLHLVSTAPVINQASVLADVPFDIDGQSRGSSPDVGADEFNGTTPGDTTPPTISSIAAGNITASGATVTWTTNEASDTQVEYGLTTSYGSQTTLNTSMVTSHSAQLSGLTAGTLYHYRVKSRDAAGNLSVSTDRTFTTAAAPDTTPPTISAIATSSVTTSGATATWTTNEASNTQVEYGLTTAYGSQTTLNTSMVTSHSAALAGLTANTLYHYRVKSRDAAGNLSVSADRTFTTAAAPDNTPPTISSIAAGSITATGAAITWTTNEGSDTQVEYGLTTAYGSQTTLNTSMITSHSAALAGLTANTLYHYRVKSRDSAGNLSVSADRTFTTSAAPDTTPPTISAIATSAVSTSGATVTWTTNEASNTQVEYGLTTAYGSQTTLNTSMVTSHSAQLSGLTVGTLYHYRVKSRDAAGNLSVSADRTFTTSAAANLAPIAQADAATTQSATGVTIDVLANDTDPNGDPLSILSFTQPSNGNVAAVSGRLQYTSSTSFTGSDSFTYTISDGRGGTSTAVVSLTVQQSAPTTVNVVSGRLVIGGSASNETVRITGTGNGTTGQYVVVTNQGSQTVSGVLGDISVNLGEGNDEIIINNAFVNGSISIDSGGGADVVTLGSTATVSTRLDLIVLLGGGNNALTGKRLYIGRNQKFEGGADVDSFSFLGDALPGDFVLGTSSGGTTTILGGGGADRILASYSFIVGAWQLNGGAGNDFIDVRTSACNGAVTVSGEAGVDSLVVDTNYFIATLLISGGADADRLELRNSLGLLVATLDGSTGIDSAVVSNLTAGRLALNLGAQNDMVDIRSSLFDEIFASLADQDDTITLYGNLVRRGTELDGGLGLDTLLDLGNRFTGGVRRLGFER